jgi:DNA-binding NarL/FixJ family response regulator
MSIRLLVIDEHHVIRAGVKSLVAGTDIKFVADAARADVGIRLIRKHRPDVVLLDVRMPSGDGLTAIGRIKEFPKVSVLIFSAFDNPGYVVRAIAQGAKGYLLKGTTREKLLDAIRAAARGESIWTRHQLRKVAGHGPAQKTVSDVDVALTPRESDVLKHVAAGKSNKEIAEALDISQETVKEHVQNILRKIGVVDRTQAAIWAIRNNVV